MNPTLPLISIVMPTYNMGHYLRECIPSILEQSCPDFELIIINDGSTDRTEEVIRTFPDKRIVYVYREHDYMASLNAGIRMARGKYIMRMDADDIMMPDRIKQQAEFMEKQPDIDICGGGIKNFGFINNEVYTLKDHRSIITSLLLQNSIAHPTVIMRKSRIDTYIQKYGFLYDPQFIYAEDYKLWTCLAMEGYKFANLPVLLVKHRISDQAVTVAYGQQSAQTAETVKKLYMKYAIEKIILTEGTYMGIINEMMSLADKQLLSLQDVQQLVYVLYKKILK